MADQKSLVEIWVDGSTHPKNPGTRGGWGAVLLYKNSKIHIREVSGYLSGNKVTNNQMETMAATEALNKLTTPCNVKLYTDSYYFATGFKKIKKGNTHKTNVSFWLDFKEALISGEHEVEVIQVKGHDGDEYNEKADKLAFNAAKDGAAGEVDKRYEKRN